MPISIVVGGQYGSEGKGKVADYIVRKDGAKVAVRCGGPNSGHSVVTDKGPMIFKQLPTSCMQPDVVSVISAGSYIDTNVLTHEIETAGLTPKNLMIHPNAVIVELSHRVQESDWEWGWGLSKFIGSTGSGTGAAVTSRIRRSKKFVRFANDIDVLQPFVKNPSDFLRDVIQIGGRIVIEGTQGFGLSLLHTQHYPYATSRDTTAAGFLSEAGLSPIDVDDVALVIRAMPIRVPGNSGPLNFETDWRTVNRESGADIDLTELTSVTKTVRRVAHFNAGLVREAIKANNPTRIFMNHLDLIDFGCRDGKTTSKARVFLSTAAADIGRNIRYYGAGPGHLAVYRDSIERLKYA